MSTFIKVDSIHNESDVEQKVLMPLFSMPCPLGLGYSNSEILTKFSIKRLGIGKGGARHLYYPDYLIILSGLPVLVGEAKSPETDDLTEGLDEARMYAAQLNKLFSADVNPCKWVLSSNGKVLTLSKWDSYDFTKSVPIEDINVGDAIYAEINNLICRATLSKYANDIFKKVHTRPYAQAISLVGGSAVRNEEMEPNTFGSSVALDFRHIFSPSTLADRAYLVKNAYVKSQRRQRYVEPIDRFIRQIVTPGIRSLRNIEDTSVPVELLDVIRPGRSLEHQILLLVGSVGSGKSTFIDYLVNVALSAESMSKTVWLRIDLNNAPIDMSSANGWLIKSIIKELKLSDPGIDFEDINTLFRVYAPEIRNLKKGALSLLGEGTSEYKSKLAEELLYMQKDEILTAKSLARYLCSDRGRLLVVVLDNCDKRNRDDQLLMFQLANWTQSEINAAVVLPIRDVTYENHRNEPPLDTAQKDLIFRIEPPQFTEVLRGRFFLALKEMEKKGESRELEYFLKNGVRVTYPASDQGVYLASILKSLFEYDRFLRRLLTGLAGRDIRKAIEMFLEFCRSGHINEAEILKIRGAKGDYVLPLPIVTRVLLRMNRRFYDGNISFLKNLFQCDPADSKPDHFIRIAILRYLDNRVRTIGPSGLMSFHRVGDMFQKLITFGHSYERSKSELIYLLKNKCIVAEHLKTDEISEDDLAAISSSGMIHLDILENIDYLAACSEETFIDDSDVRTGIAERIGKNKYSQYSTGTTYENANAFYYYLEKKKNEELCDPSNYLESETSEDLHCFDKIKGEIDYYSQKVIRAKESGKIYIGNLPFNMAQEDLEIMLKKIEIRVISIFFPLEGKRSKGYAFIKIPNDVDMDTELRKINKLNIEGRKIVARPAEPK